VVPAEAVLDIDMRFPSAALGDAAVEAIMKTLPQGPDITLTVTGGITRPAFEKTAGAAALLEHARGLAAEIGFTIGDYASGGGSDGNFTAPIAPTLDGIGVDGKGPHTHFEQASIASLVPQARLHLRLLQTLS